MTIGERIRSLPTPAKLLLMLSLALLPIGAALVWSSIGGLREASRAIRLTSDHEAEVVGDSLNSLMARNALALRIAANAALKGSGPGACDEARRILAIAPAVAQSFELEAGDGQPICAIGDFSDLDRPPLTAPGDIREWISNDGHSVLLRVGVPGGSATTRLRAHELQGVVADTSPNIETLRLDDRRILLGLFDRASDSNGGQLVRRDVTIGNGDLVARFQVRERSISTIERLIILLPVLMWALAAIVSWWLVHRLLISPLRRLQRAVGEFQPGGDNQLTLPEELGPATEIRELGEAFVRAVTRIDQSERQMAAALEGQTRLVREVHHRVKNNLQVVASLLSIHGRTAVDAPSKAAYAAIGRRVDALSVVHRNHYAELEESQGIALRPMLTELASGLRASTPEASPPIPLDVEIDHVSTTQDVAVAVAFLITEVVEYAMLHANAAPVEIVLTRSSDLTARLTLTSAALLDQDEETTARVQFHRIVDALARQLRAPLERKLGSYTVELPVFPRRDPRTGKRPRTS